jgi:hypothetical protein
VTIEPDTKDWTWVLARPCPECGFDATAVSCTDVAARLRSDTRQWHDALSGLGEVRTRPKPGVWSTLEYGCHVRDVFGLYRQRLRLMLAEDDPAYPNWDQDAEAVEGRYEEQAAKTVAAELTAAGTALADAFDDVPASDWQRTGRRSDGASFTIDTFSRYLLHDVVHHLWDVRGRSPGRP